MINLPSKKKGKPESFWIKILEAILSGATIYLTISLVLQVQFCSNNPIEINLCKCPEIWREIPCEGEDSLGHKAKFVIAILTEEEKWKYGSDMILEKSGNFRSSFPNYLDSLPYIRENFGLICVGTASKDGSSISQYDLAERRANEIIRSVRPFSTKKNDIFKLNLGQYSTKEKDIADQRSVIVVGILEKDSSMNETSIKQACYDALEKQLKNAIKLDIGNYTHFEFTSVKNI